MISLFALVALLQVELPGTQPNTLRVRLSPPSSCHNCHRGFERSAGDTWAGSMMANAARDPSYLAALTIANQDVPGIGEFCIRCHSPRAWLSGRSQTPDGSMLDAVDLAAGVDCDVCHRLYEGDGAHIGNGQYQVIDEGVSFGRYDDAFAQHGTRASAYTTSSELCGLCHDVTNPLTGFPIERTYTEWKNSLYAGPAAQGGRSCIDCHMPAAPGRIALGDGLPERRLHAHDLAGGNTWMPTVLAALYPDDADALLYAADAARAMLQDAATLEIETPASTPHGADFAFTVRVTNESGHKLPTGYPEGRRCWLEVEVLDATGRPLMHSGAYDEAISDRIDDPQLRTYEARLSQDEHPTETFHFVLQDTRLQDNRIPPRGFRPDPLTAPVGRDYPVLPDGSLAYYDDAPYTLALAEDTPGPLTVRARLRYQTISRAYVTFLRDRNVTDDRGQTLYDLWEAHGGSPPETIAEALTTVALHAPPPPDAAFADAGRPDAGPDAPSTGALPGEGGCSTAPASPPHRWPALLLALGLIRRARRRA